jgi:hypothetical protein
MTQINELKEISENIKLIRGLSDEEQHQLYLRIKASLPQLKVLFPTTDFAQVIAEYEHRNSIV